MLPKKTVEDLLDAKSTHELQDTFLSTYYGRYLEEEEKFTPVEIELALQRHFFEVYTSISRFVTGEEAKFLNALLKTFEVINLKRILSAMHSHRSIDETMPYLIPVSKHTLAYYHGLLESDTIKQAISKISDDKLRGAPSLVFPYYLSLSLISKISDATPREALEKAYPQYESTNMIFFLESALDRQIYTHLWKIASNWKTKKFFGARERFVIKNLIGEKIDLTNILITLRALSLGLNPEDFILPVAYKLKNELDKAIESANMRDALDIFSRSLYYGALLNQIREEGVTDVISNLELIFHRFHAKKCRTKLADYPFQISPIYCFFTLKFFETQDLKTIMIGKLEGIDSADILKLLVLY